MTGNPIIDLQLHKSHFLSTPSQNELINKPKNTNDASTVGYWETEG